MRIGLRARFIIVITAVLAIIFALIATFLIRNARQSLRDDLNASSKAFAELATRPIGDTYNVYRKSGAVRVGQESAKFTDLNANVIGVSIVDLNGAVSLAIKGTPQSTTTAAVASFDPTYVNDKDGNSSQIVEPYLDANGLHPFGIVYSISPASLNDAINRQALAIFIFSLIGLLISAFAVYELIDTLFLRPVEKVSRLALVVSKGNYNQGIDVHRSDEIGDLARSVNQMANTLKGDILKLQEVDRMKNEFIMITSHNLRTPLTIIKGNIDLIKDKKLPAGAGDLLKAVEMSALSLAVFSEDMLTIASIEAGNNNLVRGDVPVGRIVSRLQEDFEPMAQQKGIKMIWVTPPEETVLHLSEMHIRVAMSNLLGNAIKFTPKRGTVTTTISQTPTEVVIAVSDNGIGISAEEIPKLFTKFHRGTSTLQYDYEGTGIGLYATKLVVEAHGGTVDVQSRLGQGSTFTIHLPK